MTTADEYDEAIAELDQQHSNGEIADDDFGRRRRALELSKRRSTEPQTKADRCAEAIDRIEAQLAAGTITRGQYEATRASLLAEMSRKPMSGALRLLLTIAAIVAILIITFYVLRLVVAGLNA